VVYDLSTLDDAKRCVRHSFNWLIKVFLFEKLKSYRAKGFLTNITDILRLKAHSNLWSSIRKLFPIISRLKASLIMKKMVFKAFCLCAMNIYLGLAIRKGLAIRNYFELTNVFLIASSDCFTLGK